LKKYICILAIVLTGCGADGKSSSSPEESKIGFFYTFDNTGSVIVDSSDADNNATADAISRVEGKIGSAVKFQTLGSVIEAPRDSFPVTESLTFRAWIKTDVSFTDRQQLIGAWTGGAPGSFYPINNFGISFIDNKLSFEVSSYPNMLSVESITLPIGVDEWFQVAITYDGSQIKYFFNGEVISEGSIISSFDSSFGNQLGHNYHVFGGVTIVDQFYGYLDEFYLSEQVLTEQEILEYYNSTK